MLDFFKVLLYKFKFLGDPPHKARLGFITHTKKTFELFLTMERKDFLPEEKRKAHPKHTRNAVNEISETFRNL